MASGRHDILSWPLSFPHIPSIIAVSAMFKHGSDGTCQERGLEWKGFCVCVCTEVLVGYIKEKRFFVCFFSHYIKENTVSDLAIPGI